jgi:hypothetical protein
VDQHGPVALAVLLREDSPNQKRRKAEQREWQVREGHGMQARSVKTFRKVGDVKTLPLTCGNKAT